MKDGMKAVALGNFDGLHKGHISVLENTLCAAQKLGIAATALIFDTHPMAQLMGRAPDLIMTAQSRDEKIKTMGITPVTVSFAEIMDYSCEEFVRIILHERLNARVVSCGFNYRFGKSGAGNCEKLKELCSAYGIETVIADEVDIDGAPVSSTRIRKAIKEGNVQLAKKMLGRPFSYTLPVIHGKELGRSLGFPTANQRFPDGFIVPLKGVYASVVRISGEEAHIGVTDIGTRPTVNGYGILSETHIVHYAGNLYDKVVTVELVEYLREERTFSSLDKLKEQILQDTARAVDIVTKRTKDVF